MKLEAVARAAVPGEEVVAAGIFQASGSLTARMSGFGEISVRRREQEERASSGLAFKRYLLLVLTPTRLHMFDARSGMGSWTARGRLATWDRSALHATSDPRSVTTRLTLDIPSENRRVQLEAPRARRSSSGEVARLLAGQATMASSPIGASAAPKPRANEESGPLHAKIGWLGVVGGTTRLLAYLLPWIVATSISTGRSVTVSGFDVLGAPVVSIGYAIAVVVAAVLYLVGRREGSPRLLLSLGIGSVIAFVIHFPMTLNQVEPLRTALDAQGISASVSVAFGVWVELAGTALTCLAGIWASRVAKQTSPPRGAYLPHRPDVHPPALGETFDRTT